MTPFQELRVWTRRASAGDQIAAAFAAIVSVGLLAWALVPTTNRTADLAVAAPPSEATTTAGADTATTATTPGAAPRAPSATALATGPSVTTRVNGRPAGGMGQAAATATAGDGCTAPPGSDQGVTATEIKVAVIVIDTSGSGSLVLAFDVPTTSEQQSNYQHVIDDLNAHGGVACRKFVPQYFLVNPVDQTTLQQRCLDIAQAHPFAVIDFGGYGLLPALTACYAQHELPFFGSGFLPDEIKDKHYPYLFGSASMETVYRNAVFALRDRGFFSAGNGFKKLGFLYRDCIPEVIDQFNGWLREAGLSPSEVIPYNLGCPSGFAPPSDIQQAILKFQQNGVTHVTTAQADADFANFTTVAQQQQFKPKYGFPDYGILATSYSNTHPDYDNIADAVAIVPRRYGEERTPGSAPTAGTVRCNAIFQARGRPPVYEQKVAAGGVACNEVWEVVAAVNHAPRLQRSALAAGLQASQSVDFSYPWGPSDFRGSRVTVGGQFWRPVQFLRSCSCWRVIDATFRPSFP